MVGKRKDLSSKSELNQLYVIDKKSMREIGELFVGGAPKIRCLLIEYKIPVQKRGAGRLGQTKETNSSIMKISKSKMGHKVSTLTRQKISKTLTGKPSPKKGKPMSQTAYDNVKKSGTWFKKGNKPVHTFEKGRISEFKGQTKETNPAIMKRSITATGKTRTDESKNKMSISRKILLKENPEIKEQALINLQKARKSMTRPNKKEREIGEILEGIGITFKFLQEVDYETLENKPASKKIDIVWKDSVGNKKIIEYNGRYHFDPRDHKPDEIHEVHNKPTKCQDLWDEENMILNQIRKTGYKILVVWQKDFLKDYENEKKRIIEFATKT